LAALDTPDEPAAETHEQLAVDRIVDLPRAVRTRVLKSWAQSRGATQLSAVHVQALEELVMNWHGQGAVHLPGGVSAQRTSGTLSMHPTATPP
jgi:tRNA(Ile)-lysidine synthase